MCDEFFGLTKYLASRGLETKGSEQQLIVQASGQLFIGVFVRLEAVFQKKFTEYGVLCHASIDEAFLLAFHVS